MVLLSVACMSQRVYRTDFKNRADIIVYEGKYMNQADLIVYRTEYNSGLGKGIWKYVKYENQADIKIYYTKYKNEADIIIYYTNYRNQAGHKTKYKHNNKMNKLSILVNCMMIGLIIINFI